MIKVDKLMNKCFLSKDYLQSQLQIEICYLLNSSKDVRSWNADLVRDVLPDTLPANHGQESALLSLLFFLTYSNWVGL